ncbi:hypothetical protein [Nocardioides sp. URHA0032]|uniref:hypothetical protein n=1 Tax=Nocardioides sp. URHA0032 TaxID=1380388 RepID=UPI00048B7014|nr:hypothetical protein [Nocardioides sp. URHA0032]
MKAAIVAQVEARTITLPAADHPLTDDEIQEHFRSLLDEGVSAFREDPEYVVAMAEAAARIQARPARVVPYRPRPSREAVARRDEEITALADEGLSGAAIARALNLASSTVYARLRRVRRAVTDSVDTSP